MLQQNISWRNDDGSKAERTYYFNYTKAELLEMEVSVDGGLSGMLQALGTNLAPREAYAILKRIVLGAYGERVVEDDGRMRFIKSARAREDFASSEAFSTLIMSFFEDVDNAVKFIRALIPEEARSEFDSKMGSRPTPQDHKPKAAPTPSQVSNWVETNVNPDGTFGTPPLLK